MRGKTDFGQGAKILDGFFRLRPELADMRGETLVAYRLLVDLFGRDGTLFVGGNGGSHADAIHIAGELMKNMERLRPIDRRHKKALAAFSGGAKMAGLIEKGLRTIPLGTNSALVTAYLNDRAASEVMFAQELYTLGRKGDVLLAISTSGNSKNILAAAMIARVIGMKVVGLTGASGGRLKKLTDCCIRVAGGQTRHVQENHEAIYHHLCVAVEAAFFPDKRR